MKYNKYKCSAVALAIGLLFYKDVLACASCGSGFADPIFLAPDEKIKSIFSIKSVQIPYSILPSGAKTKDSLMTKQKSVLEFGAAIRLSHKINMGIFWGVQNNRSKKENMTAVIDPTLSLRWTLLNQSFLNPYAPQIQILSSFKPRTGHGTEDSNRVDFLDVTGVNYTQLSLGIDLWNSMNAVFYGVSHSVQHSLKRDIDEYETQLGNLHSTLFTTGTYYYKYNKIVLGYANLYRDHRREDSNKIATSDMLQHGFFTTVDYALKADQQLRLSFNKSGIGSSRNTSETTTISLGYLKKWL